MLVVAEVVGLPLLAAFFVSWVRADDADARRMDAILDARATRRQAKSGVTDPGGRPNRASSTRTSRGRPPDGR